MWGLNLEPRDQESHVLLTKPIRGTFSISQMNIYSISESSPASLLKWSSCDEERCGLSREEPRKGWSLHYQVLCFLWSLADKLCSAAA